MIRRKAKPPEVVDEEWMLTFSDMVTLLLTFFILLASMSKIDPVKYEKMQSSLKREMGATDIAQPIDTAKKDLQEQIVSLKVDDTVSLGSDHEGLMLEFDANAFYKQGSAEMSPEGHKSMRALADTLAAQKYLGFQFEIQGHTDDNPVRSQVYPSNWELSSARAASAVRVFLEAKVEPQRLRAVGLADVAPKVPNRTADGVPLPENQAVNRRVAVRIAPR